MQPRAIRPPSTPGWSVRQVEWPAPEAVRIVGRADDAYRRALLDTDPRPADATGRSFAGDSTIWSRYPADRAAVHQVRLREMRERAGGRLRAVVVSAVFAAMDWSDPVPARSRPARAQAAPTSHRAGARTLVPQLREARIRAHEPRRTLVGGAA